MRENDDTCACQHGSVSLVPQNRTTKETNPDGERERDGQAMITEQREV